MTNKEWIKYVTQECEELGIDLSTMHKKCGGKRRWEIACIEHLKNGGILELWALLGGMGVIDEDVVGDAAIKWTVNYKVYDENNRLEKCNLEKSKGAIDAIQLSTIMSDNVLWIDKIRRSNVSNAINGIGNRFNQAKLNTTDLEFMYDLCEDVDYLMSITDIMSYEDFATNSIEKLFNKKFENIQRVRISIEELKEMYNKNHDTGEKIKDGLQDSDVSIGIVLNDVDEGYFGTDADGETVKYICYIGYKDNKMYVMDTRLVLYEIGEDGLKITATLDGFKDLITRSSYEDIKEYLKLCAICYKECHKELKK